MQAPHRTKSCGQQSSMDHGGAGKTITVRNVLKDQEEVIPPQ